MTPPTLKTAPDTIAPVTTGHDFGIEPFNLTYGPRSRTSLESYRRALHAQLNRFCPGPSKERVWARSSVAPYPRHLPDRLLRTFAGPGDVPSRILLGDVRRDPNQRRAEWDGTRLALSVTDGARVRSEHWRPLRPTQEQLWLDLSRCVTRRLTRLASVITEEPAPVVQVALTLAMHVRLCRLPAFLEFDADVFTPTLADVKAVWPEGGLDLVAFAALADGWNGTAKELLHTAVLLTT